MFYMSELHYFRIKLLLSMIFLFHYDNYFRAKKYRWKLLPSSSGVIPNLFLIYYFLSPLNLLIDIVNQLGKRPLSPVLPADIREIHRIFHIRKVMEQIRKAVAQWLQVILAKNIPLAEQIQHMLPVAPSYSSFSRKISRELPSLSSNPSSSSWYTRFPTTSKRSSSEGAPVRYMTLPLGRVAKTQEPPISSA